MNKFDLRSIIVFALEVLIRFIERRHERRHDRRSTDIEDPFTDENSENNEDYDHHQPQQSV